VAEFIVVPGTVLVAVPDIVTELIVVPGTV
jgi:hypothetical protein